MNASCLFARSSWCLTLDKSRSSRLTVLTQKREALPLLLVSLFLCFLLSFVSVAAAAQLTGKVIGVLDGDTIEVLDSSKHPHRVRLTVIDAPEKAQPFGQRAKEHLSDLVFGKQVEVQGGKTDKYGRTVGKVIVNGADANLAQVAAGFAWHYKEYAPEQTPNERALYAQAEEGARAARAVWRDPRPMAPWEWRHSGKDEPTMTSLASGCPCSAAVQCIGPKSGHFCVAPNGTKRYK